MALYVGKSGADAVFKALKHICLVINRYETKLLAAIGAAEASGLIDGSQATAAAAFVATAKVTCDIFALVAQNSGI